MMYTINHFLNYLDSSYLNISHIYYYHAPQMLRRVLRILPNMKEVIHCLIMVDNHKLIIGTSSEKMNWGYSGID